MIVLQTTETPLASGPLGTQAGTPSLVTTFWRQEVVTYPLLIFAPEPTQFATLVQSCMTCDPQVVVVKLLPFDAALGEHEATAVGPVVSVLQAVLVY